ncbi:MAG: hypothetical protein ACI3V3_04800 [Faecousia sp.]
MKRWMLCLLALCLLLCGCDTRQEDDGRKDGSGDPAITEDTASVQQEWQAVLPDRQECLEAVDSFLRLYQARDGSAGDLIAGGGTLDFGSWQGLLAGSVTFEMGNVTDEDGRMLVEVTVENVDFPAVFESVASELGEDASSQQILTALEAALADGDAPRRTFQCPVPVVQREEGCRVQISPELSNALTGGLTSYMDDSMGGTGNE